MLASRFCARTTWPYANCHPAFFSFPLSTLIRSSAGGSSADNLLKPSRRYDSSRASFQVVNVFSVANCPIDLRKHFVGQARKASNNREVIMVLLHNDGPFVGKLKPVRRHDPKVV